MLRISAYPLSIPARVRTRVWGMSNLDLIRAAGKAALSFWHTQQNSDLELAVLEEFGKRYRELKKL